MQVLTIRDHSLSIVPIFSKKLVYDYYKKHGLVGVRWSVKERGIKDNEAKKIKKVILRVRGGKADGKEDDKKA